MQKSFKVEGLDCPKCAMRLEKGISKIEGITSAQVVFATQKIIIDAPDDRFEELLDEACAVCSKLEPEWSIVR